MAITVYNPRFIESEGRKLPSADIKGFVWSHARWDLRINELKKFPDEVGRALLHIYEFLVEVTPKNLEQIKKVQLEKQFKCEHCPFSTDTKVAFLTHVRTQHGNEKEVEAFKEVEEAKPTEVFGIRVPKQTPEQLEGIPNTTSGSKKDKDGVEWYGEGEENDRI